MSTTPQSQAPASRLSSGWHEAVVLLLTITGGSLDAIVILGFSVLTAAQTGNTILLAVALIQHRFATGIHSAISVASYVTGAALGELISVKNPHSLKTLRGIRWSLATELALLGCLLFLWHISSVKPSFGSASLFIVLAAVAMGIQSAAVIEFHSGPKTTYVTGTLTNFTTKAIRWLRFLETAPQSSASRQSHDSHDSQPADRPWMYGASWIVYAGAAALGGVLFLRIHELALFLPLGSIACAIAVAAFPHRP